MQILRFEKMTISAANLGPENPLPPLHSTRDIHTEGKKKDIPGIPDEILHNMAYGHIPNILPYTMQDGYTRLRQNREIHVAVLENEILRATFLLERGGRLYSMIHKPSGRELLDRNPVFQPANLALRNAWFSGGVEWNIGTIGHCPFTCSPLFAAQLHTEDGAPVLRMYEFERIRKVPFQIDAYLPSGSPVLFVRVRISNPNSTTIPMYWWSNIAVPETHNTRVVVPADGAYSFGYGTDGMARVPIPETGGVDVTYPTNINRAADFFFDIPDNRRHWITALDENGSGLIQTSTARLKGRKLFLWGMGQGGRRWQTFLSQKGQAYIEIQAGLARTQREHIPMPANSEWVWLEAYGLMETDAKAVHGSNWVDAQNAVEEQLQNLISRQTLNAELASGSTWADNPPEIIMQHGSGWGALEQLRRREQGLSSLCSQALNFDQVSLSEEQSPWVQLLRTGTFPEQDPEMTPTAYMIQDEWHLTLEESLKGEAHNNWAAWMHLGIMRYQLDDIKGARQAWETSLSQCPTPWLARNLAVLAWQEQRFDDATGLYEMALRLRPDVVQLAIECGRMLLAMERPNRWLDLLDILPNNVKSTGRIQLLEGQAALAVGDLPRVASLFESNLVIDDLREGERSLSHLWYDYHEQRLSKELAVPIDDPLREKVRQLFPVPEFIDFRMSSDEPVTSHE